MRTLPAISACFALLLSAGCASYRYDIAAPDTPDRQVRKDADLVIPATPAELRLRQVDSRCVLLVRNPTTQPFSIDGSTSAIVDPKSQSRAIGGQLIPPGSFAKFIVPPMQQAEPRGPEFRIGIGVGMQVQGPPAPTEPRQAVYLQSGAGPMEYWEWDGPGSIRLILAIKSDGQPAPTRYEFVLTRSKQ
jgi:hypothetical protein